MFAVAKINATTLVSRRTEKDQGKSPVDDVFDVVMDGLVRPSFVWLYVKGHLCRTHMGAGVSIAATLSVLHARRQVMATFT